LNLPCLKSPRVHTAQQSTAPGCAHCALPRSTGIRQPLPALSMSRPSHRSSGPSFQETSPSCCQQSTHRRWTRFFQELPGVLLVRHNPSAFFFLLTRMSPFSAVNHSMNWLWICVDTSCVLGKSARNAFGLIATRHLRNKSLFATASAYASKSTLC
jgi:hypothetical protein